MGFGSFEKHFSKSHLRNRSQSEGNIFLLFKFLNRLRFLFNKLLLAFIKICDVQYNRGYCLDRGADGLELYLPATSLNVGRIGR